MIDGSASDGDLVGFLVDVKNDFPADSALAARLATVLADSGERFRLESTITADVASTGGPGSLSTLLCPLLLRVAGCEVVKLGVPGRPAGGIDCLAQLRDYRTALSPADLATILQRCGFAHFLASGMYAPLDARVFRLRQQHGLQDVPTLVAASLLSKKLAVGVRYVGLDVRVGPHGNFGRTWEEASANAAMLVQAADMLGIDARPVLTDGVHSYQPYIGRKEALAALWLLFESKADPWLVNHLELCRTIALACVPAERKLAVARADASMLRDVFYSNLEAQGASPDEFANVSSSTLKSHVETLCAPADGFVGYAMADVRQVMVEAQRAGTTPECPYPDPVGLVLLRRPGEWVQRGEPIATLRLDGSASERTATACRKLVATYALPAGHGFEAVRLYG